MQPSWDNLKTFGQLGLHCPQEHEDEDEDEDENEDEDEDECLTSRSWLMFSLCPAMFLKVKEGSLTAAFQGRYVIEFSWRTNSMSRILRVLPRIESFVQRIFKDKVWSILCVLKVIIICARTRTFFFKVAQNLKAWHFQWHTPTHSLDYSIVSSPIARKSLA